MSTDRRTFLKQSAGALAAAPLVIPAHAFGANDRPAYGVIGTGSRARGLNKTFQKLGAQCVALADPYEVNLKGAQQESPAGAKAYEDFHELLARKDIDFVVIGTPDHWHCPNLLEALAAGKDVYIEKPLSHSLEQSRTMIAAVRKTDRIVQVGMQRRSMPFIHKAKRVIDDGALGRISAVRPMWNWHFDMPLDNSPLPGKVNWELFQGQAERHEFEPMRVRWWRGFYAYSGGNMTDQGTHLMDVVQWMTNSGPPVSAVALGKQNTMPGGDVPNVFTAVFEYPTFLATWSLDYRSAFHFDWSIEFVGENAVMVMNRFGYKMYKDPGSSPAPWTTREQMDVTGEEPDKDSAEAHQQNFLDCIRSRKQPNCTVEIAAAAVAGPHMANLSLREDRKVRASG
jgi:predicted dehydrogenase